jgi:hypothetical protein
MEVDFNPTESSLDLALSVAPKEMISITQVGKQTVVRVNSSSLSLLQECMRKAQYALLEGWKVTDESPATVFGSAIHRAQEIFYRGDLKERILPKLEDLEMMAYGHGAASNGLIERAVAGFLEKAEPLRPLPEGDKRSLLNGVWILHHYFKAFLADPWVCIVDVHGPFVERGFTYRTLDTSALAIDLFGTIDFAWKHTTTGEVVVGDHKTSSALNFGGSSYFDRDKPNHQYSAYMLGAQKVFGFDTQNFVVNVLEVKARPKTSRGQPPSFPRQVTTRTEEDLIEFQEVLEYYVRRYLEAIDANYFPLGPVQSCNSYGSCQFKQVCSQPKSMRRNILEAKFRSVHG